MDSRTIVPCQAAPGLSLLEVGLTVMILAVISVGVSGLVKSGVESQLATRANQSMQTAALNIVDDIRLDFRSACSASVQNGGRRLVIDIPPCAATNQPTQADITYEWTAGDNFERTQAGVGTKRYNDPAIVNMPVRVDCIDASTSSNTCFTALQMNNDPVPKPKQIQINAIHVYQATPIGGGSMIDLQFGMPHFTVRQFSFDIMSATEFQ